MVRFTFRTILTLAVSAALVVSAPADTVTLTSGKVLDNVTVKDEGNGKFRVTKADGSSVVYPRTMIEKIEREPTPSEALAARQKALDAKDVKGRIDLATWCEEKDLSKEAQALYEEALAIDAVSDRPIVHHV